MNQLIEYQFASLGPALRIVVLLFMLGFALLLCGVIVAIAMLPGRIAKGRQHPQAEAIAICGWVGLPTGILWAAALVWAFVKTSDSAADNVDLANDANLRSLSDQVAGLEATVAQLEQALAGGRR